MSNSNSNTRISIIVPMYNVAPFIEECLQSMWNQDLGEDEYEVVIINDGCTDDSLPLAQRAISSHPNARILSQENKGLSEARNAGLSEAQGDYIWFVDADDWIAPNCLRSICQKMEEGLSVLAIGANSYTETKSSQFSYPESSAMPGYRFMEKWEDQLKACAPFYIYRKSFLLDNQLSFFPGIYHEDNEFTPRAVTLANTIASCQNPYYQRRIRSGSITSSVNPKRPLDIIVAMKSLHSFSTNYSGRTRVALDTYIANTLNFACKLSSRTDKASQKHFVDALNNELWIKGALLNSSKMKFKVEGALLQLFPKQLFRIHKGLMLFNPKKGYSSPSRIV